MLRHENVVLLANLTLLVLAVPATLAGCDGGLSTRFRALPSEEPFSCNRSFTGVLHSASSGPTLPQQRLIENQADWCVFWDQAHADSEPAPACDLSLIDFAREVAVVAALGTRMTGGYQVTIDCVHAAEGSEEIDVLVTETVPGPRCLVTQGVTHPFDAVKVDRPVGHATFVKQTVTKDCS